MSTVLARLDMMELELPARRSAGEHVVVDGASSLLLSLFDDRGADACLMADSCVWVAGLVINIAVEMVADVMGP